VRKGSLVVVVPGALGALAIASAAAASSVPSVQLSLTRPLPSVVRQTTRVTVRGHASGSPRRAHAALELQPSYPQPPPPWQVLASAPLAHNGAFKLTWSVPTTEQIGPVSLRVVLLNRRGALIATTPTAQSAVGPTPVYCAKPTPPMVDIPVGDGWIVGGRYGRGGAFPGIYACDSQQYTVTATDSNGHVQATQTVAGRHSYTLVVPAGSYTLRSDFCQGTATVRPGEQTTANTYCNYP
jgi:hypothetical protein